MQDKSHYTRYNYKKLYELAVEMFIRYDKGETTQRIAAGIFEAVSNYDYGIQLASFYLRGN